MPLAKVRCAAVFEVAKFFFLPFGRGARLSSERELACPATLPQIPIPACLVILVIVNFKHSRPPLFVTWWPKWPELAEATSGASGCSGGLEKRAPARPPCRLPHVPSFFAIHIHTALMRFPSGPISVKQEHDLGPHVALMIFSDRHQDQPRNYRHRTGHQDH